jgi:hypothetical protein
MNQAIKSLADKCEIHEVGIYGNSKSAVFDKEKFARLIVQECCKMVNAHMQHNNPHDCLLVLDIKEKFGIEPNER